MIILKKILRKLYHFIAFLSLFVFFTPIVKADNNLYVNYSGLVTSYANYNNSIQCNATNCVVYNVRYYFNQDFTTKWTTSTSQTCQNGASLTGKFSTTGSGEWILNTDWLSDHLKQVFIDTNNNRYSCSFSFSTSSTGNADINYSCYVPKLTANFSVGYVFARSSSSSTYTNATEVVANRNFTFDCDNTASSIIDNNNVNTDRITNNNNYNSDRIINNNNQNTQDIINNNNSNTQQQIESQKVCTIKDIDKNNIEIDNKYLANNGILVDSTILGVTSYIKLNSSSTLTITRSNSATSCFYDENKSFISCFQTSSTGEVSIPQNAKYFRSTIQKGTNAPTFRLKYCTNGNQALTDSITDSDVDSSDSTINDLKSRIPTNSVISDLLLLPVRFLQNFVNALGSSCSQFNLGSLYGTNLYMPCINIENYLGSGIWTTIDLIISGLFVYSLRKKFIQIYENLTNLKNGGNEVD